MLTVVSIMLRALLEARGKIAIIRMIEGLSFRFSWLEQCPGSCRCCRKFRSLACLQQSTPNGERHYPRLMMDRVLGREFRCQSKMGHWCLEPILLQLLAISRSLLLDPRRSQMVCWGHPSEECPWLMMDRVLGRGFQQWSHG